MNQSQEELKVSLKSSKYIIQPISFSYKMSLNHGILNKNK